MLKIKILQYQIGPYSKMKLHYFYWKNFSIMQILSKTILANLKVLFSKKDLNKADRILPMKLF